MLSHSLRLVHTRIRNVCILYKLPPYEFTFFGTEVHLSLSNHVTEKFTGMCSTIEAVALPPSDSSTQARTHTPPVL